MDSLQFVVKNGIVVGGSARSILPRLKSMDILILGASGQVGTELLRFAWPRGTSVYAPSRAQLNLSDKCAVERAVSARKWSVVINAAAYTAVDKAESDIPTAWCINALAPAILAAETARNDIPLVHISTDYVFDGAADRPYVESDPVGPLGVYGASKEAGEQAVRSANPRHAIVRTAWVVSPHRSNFVKTMLKLASERDCLRVVHDQRGCPTSAADLASALAFIAQRVGRDYDAPFGTYHVVNSGETTWYEFAQEIMAQAALRGARTAPVKPINTVDFPTAAKRPANSRLCADKLGCDYGVTIRGWRPALSQILDQLIGRACASRSFDCTPLANNERRPFEPLQKG
jgi:dTDP-4-dehydrorhamnose reductase